MVEVSNLILLYAFRYTLHASATMADYTIHYLKENWDTLGVSMRYSVRDETEEAIIHGGVPALEQWVNFLDWTKAQDV